MTEIAIKDLRDLCLKALTKTGLSDEHAEITVDHYLENECSGKTSHGMVRVSEGIKHIGKYGLSDTEPTIENDKGNFVTINGNRNLGPVIGKMVVDESIKRTKEHGMSFVGGKNFFVNAGSMAYYLRKLTEENLIGIMSCNSVATVAAPDGKERLLGTNPIGLGVPSANGDNFIADFATSAIAYGKVMVAVDKGESLPEGCIIDKDGNPSTDPTDAKKDGAILPLADYRGFALGLFVEMMAAVFGADTLQKDMYGNDGIFIIAIDPNKLGNTGYAQQMSEMLKQVRGSDPAPGKDNVSIPGDRSAEKLKQTLEAGVVDVADKTLKSIQDLV